jgi:GT2 family glycosyltransferase
MSIQKTLYFSATKGSKKDTLLYKNTSSYNKFFFAENNTKPLPVVYNKAIDLAIKGKKDYLVLCHDDVIIESDVPYKLPDLLRNDFDIIGVAGTTHCKISKPALWHIMGGGFEGGHLHGAVAHGDQTEKRITSFGSYPKRVVLLDGVFMAIHRRVFENLRFDESNPAGFHFYDLSYSLDATLAGYKVDVSDIMITHASPGLREYTPEFLEGEKWFLEKYSKYEEKVLTI